MSEENPDRYCQGGYHPVRLGETFGDRYQIVSKLGFGVYSTVWLARDVSSRLPRHVALKVLTADSYGSTKPTYELDILEHIKMTDTSHPGYSHVVHLSDFFVHEGQHGSHLCLVLDLMGQSVLTLQQQSPDMQIPISLGRHIARQMLQALDWLHRSCGVIHTDIKPDNILIELPDTEDIIQRCINESEQSWVGQNHIQASRPVMHDSITASSNIKIRITDFGVASWNHNHLTEWVQPPSLRAPEVFLGAPWSYSVDIWGFAWVIYELLQGRVLFRGRPDPKNAWTAEDDQLAQMIELFGPVPESIRSAGKLSSKYFDENGGLLHIKHLYPLSFRELLAQTTNPSFSVSDYDEFETFLRDMLQYEPGKRKTSDELLASTWL